MSSDSSQLESRLKRVGNSAWWRRAVLLVVFLIALWLRVGPAWDHVFDDGGVWFQGNDAWIHARLSEHWRANFPKRLTVDPFLLHVEGQAIPGQPVPVKPLWDLMLAAPAWATGLTAAQTKVWVAWAPALLGAAGVLALYGLARALFGTLVGVLAAALLAVAPGAYLARSRLGFADHHALEAVLTVAVLWGVVKILHSAGAGKVKHAVGWSVVAGVLLGLYQLAWSGAALLVALLCLWMIVQTLMEWKDGCAKERMMVRFLPIMLVVAGGLAVLDFGTDMRSRLQVLAIGGTLVGALFLQVVGWILRRGSGVRRLQLISLALIAALAAVGVWWALPTALLESLTVDLLRFTPKGEGLTVSEMAPLFGTGAVSPLLVIWLNFRSLLFVGVIGMVFSVVRPLPRTTRRLAGVHRGAATLVLLWAVAMLLATVAQSRFGYYLAPALCLFSALACRHLFDLARFAASTSKGRFLQSAIAVGVLVLIMFLPSWEASRASVTLDQTPPKYWREALSWLREHAKEPFDDPSAFRAFPEDLVDAECSYGVLSWWDQGYWIQNLARLPPLANPTQTGAREAAAFFLETDPGRMREALEGMGAGFVVVDFRFAAHAIGSGMVFGGFPAAMTAWSSKAAADLYETLPVRTGTSWRPRTLFYEAYFRSASVRLASFGAKGSTPNGPVLTARIGTINEQGQAPQRAVLETRAYRDYGQARRAVDANSSWRIVSLDPRQAPIPLSPIQLTELQGPNETVRIYQVDGLRSASCGLTVLTPSE